LETQNKEAERQTCLMQALETGCPLPQEAVAQWHQRCVCALITGDRPVVAIGIAENT